MMNKQKLRGEIKLREKIHSEILKIEEQYNVKICYAVESGSRAWGFPSKDSDYDVRFIYTHKKEWYLSIDQKRDVIELPINDYLDMSGWELRKVLQLFKKSNPSLLEWLHSGIVYYQAYSLVDRMLAMEEKVFLPQSALYHYLNMAKRNFRSYLNRDLVKIKKYFSVLRPLLACNWIEKYNTFPPNEFQILMNELPKEGQLRLEIQTLLNRKISGDVLSNKSEVMAINSFVLKELIRLEEYAKTLKVSKQDITPMLNDLFREVLEEVWS
jgi:predicted nucleotidyltransferase